MSLLALPNELLMVHIPTFLDKQGDFAALVRTNRHLYQLLITELYRNDIRKKGSTGLIRAAKSGQVKAVRRFIQQGANLHTDQTNQRPPLDGVRTRGSVSKGNALFFAGACGHVEIVRLLLDAGADPNRGSNHPGPEPYLLKPLYRAIVYPQLDIAALLLERGAKFPSFEGDGFHRLLWCGSVELVQLLLDHGASVDQRDRRGMTPLHCAIESLHEKPGSRPLLVEDEVSTLAVVELLFKRGGAPRRRGTGYRQEDLDTVLLAAKHSNPRVRQLFSFSEPAEVSRASCEKPEEDYQLMHRFLRNTELS